jgi:hypothetical protein
MFVRNPHSPALKALVLALFLVPAAHLRAAEPQPASGEAPVPESSATPPTAAPTAATASAPVELPTFRFGLWEFKRTQSRADTPKPQVTTIRRCADPGADMRAKTEALKKKGCQFAPLRRSADRYISSWVCQMPTGAMRFRDVLLVKDPNSYEDVSETHTSQHVMHQKIEGRRLGECPGMGSGAPLKPTPKPPVSHP